MPAPVRVHVTHTFKSDPATVFEALSEHREPRTYLRREDHPACSDGETSNATVSDRRGSSRSDPAPAFVETVTVAEPNSLDRVQVTRARSPLKGHHGIQKLTPTDDGGTQLDYTIAFDSKIPGLAGVVAKTVTKTLTAGLPNLVP